MIAVRGQQRQQDRCQWQLMHLIAQLVLFQDSHWKFSTENIGKERDQKICKSHACAFTTVIIRRGDIFQDRIANISRSRVCESLTFWATISKSQNTLLVSLLELKKLIERNEQNVWISRSLIPWGTKDFHVVKILYQDKGSAEVADDIF